MKRKSRGKPEGKVEEELRKELWKAETEQLRKELWKARGRRSRAAGASLLIICGIFLFLAYYTRYITFEVISILSLLLGVVLIFISAERNVKVSVANRVATSPLIPLGRLLSHLKVHGKAIYIPATLEKDSGRIFISTHGGSSLPDIEEIITKGDIVVSDKGVLLPSVGNALLQLYEEELEDLRNVDFDYLAEWLPRVLVDGLQIAEKAEITRKAEEIRVKLTKSAFLYMCQDVEIAKTICETTGCPVCSSIADAIAKTTSRVLYYLGCSYDPSTQAINAVYRLGPTLKKQEKG